MLAKRVRAVLPIVGALVALAGFAPAALAQGGVNATDDSINAAPTGVRDVLANDTGDPTSLRVASNTQPANGTATCSELGACFYEANDGFTGSDTFTYTARDTTGATDTATVTVTVGQASQQDNVIARDDNVATLRDRALDDIRPLANDSGDGIQITSNGDATHGTVACDNASCTYTPDAGYSGSDGFVYTIGRGGKARVALGGNGGPTGPREASAAVHILVAPAGTGYGIDTTGGPNPVASGGQATWGLRVLGMPEGISGQELRALGLPSGTAENSGGPHALTGGGLQFAPGFTGQVGGDGKLSFSAGDEALLGEAVTQSFPKPLPPISQGTGGDGHVPILVGSKVFAFFHHQDPSQVTCVDRATGSVCPGYPKSLRHPDSNGFGTTDINGPGVVSGSKLWTHLENSNQYSGSASIGLFCWDSATDSTCGLTIVDRVAENEDPGASAPWLANGKMWFGGDTGKLYCVDPATGAVCDPIDTGFAPITSNEYYDAVAHGNRVFLARRQGPTGVACIDVAARAACSGWTNPKTNAQGRWNVVNQKNAAGQDIGVCAFFSSNGTCYPDADPNATTEITNFVNQDSFSQGYSHSLEAEFGNRTLVGMLNRGGAGCYDWSTLAPCTGGDYGKDGAPAGWITRESNGGNSLPSAYGVASDGSCGIALGDPGRVFTVDPAGSSPCLSLGSGTDKTVIDLRDQRCDGTVGSASWRDVKLQDTNQDEMDSVVVTVRDEATGEVLASKEMIGGDQALDLSGIDPNAHPAITIDATAKAKSGNQAWDDGIPPRIRATWRSDPQQACVKSNADNACGASPVGIGVRGRLDNGAEDVAGLSLLRNACAGGVQGTQARSCTSRRRFTITLRIEKELRRLKAKKSHVKSVRVRVAGKRAKVFRRGGRWRARIDLRGLQRNRYAIRITVTLKNGDKITGTRRHRTCRKAIAGGPPRL